MKKWDQFFPDLLIDLPGCPNPTIEHALLRAAQQFFSGAHVWKIWLDNTATSLNVTQYDIALEPNSELVRLERATLDGRPIGIKVPESLPADWQTNTAGIADCIFTSDRKTLFLLPAKAAGLILRVEATLKPANSATGIEDDLFDQYADTIAMGAKARLMQQLGKPYTNMTDGATYEQRFMTAIKTIEFQRFRAFSSTSPRARVKTF